MNVKLNLDTFDWDHGAQVYRDGWHALEVARSIPECICLRETNLHMQWHVGVEFGRKQVLAIKAALVTQDPERVHVHFWCNRDLRDNDWYAEVAPYVHFHRYDPVHESEGTPLEGLPESMLRATDHLCWANSDLFRLLIPYKYGGVYIDQDVVLLRSLAPLLANDFVYQWGTELDKMNGAVLHMKRGSLFGKIALGFLPWVPWSPASTDWSATLYSAVRQVYKGWLVMPCMFFNSEWQVYWNMSERGAHPFLRGEHSDEMFEGAFAWHWHNKWDAEIEPGSKWAQIEARVNARFAEMVAGRELRKAA